MHIKSYYSCPFLLSSLIFLCSYLAAVHGGDTISPNQSLSGDQTIASSNFVLGFFKPGNASKYYIGIWYKNVTKQTVVWVANRETAVSDKATAELRIVAGNLVLLDESRIAVWNTSITPAAAGPVSAVLLDSGNLILRDVSGPDLGSSTPLWRSFDNPANTWLPGGKLAYDKRTNKKQLLTSWKNSDDPAPGLFSLELDPGNKQYLIKWNRSVQYWRSGPWNDQIFSLVPEMRSNYLYDFSYVDTDNESYFTYSLYSSSVISRFVMDVSGQIKQFTWLKDQNQWNLFWSQPRQQCEVHAFCGPFAACQESLPFCNCLDGFKITSDGDWSRNDYSGGCTRKTGLQCGGRDKFKASPQMNQPDRPISVSGVGSDSDCESICSGNCSCTAYAYDVSNGCSVWMRELQNLVQLAQNDGGGKTVNIRLSASEFSSGKGNGLVIGAVFGSVVFGLLALSGAVFWSRQRRHLVGTTKAAVEGSLVAFSYRDLQCATRNFSEKLGSGGFGSVFKGALPDPSSPAIAVKKLEGISQGEKQFRTEVSTIGTIQHVNLVRLRGFCSEGNKKLLVYDYMPNGSLDSCLFTQTNGPKFLDWKSRYEIALGIARGLSYLHEKCRDCIIHCDIKPENILLDSQMCPKVADFGLAKLVGRDFSRVLTTMRGTRGYLAPEWISGVPITPKADVYSYGMMVFELLSGTRNSEHPKVKFFPSWAASHVILKQGDVLDVLDPKLDRVADPEEVSRMCRVGFWCIQDDENQRPSMGNVVQILEGVLDVKLPPIPSSLHVFGGDEEQDIVFFTESSSSQSSSQTHPKTSRNASLVKNH